MTGSCVLFVSAKKHFAAFAAFAPHMEYFALVVLLQHCRTWNIERSSYEMAESANSSKDSSIIAAACDETFALCPFCTAADSVSH